MKYLLQEKYVILEVGESQSRLANIKKSNCIMAKSSKYFQVSCMQQNLRVPVNVLQAENQGRYAELLDQ